MGQYVQISIPLFLSIVNYFVDRAKEETDHPEEYEWIRSQLYKKVDAMYRHDLYTTYKTSKDPVKSESARQEYLDEVGMRESFRYKR